MTKIKFLIMTATLVMGFISCSENDPGVVKPEQKPEPTPVGTPVGVASSKTIGATGGTISSADGMLMVEIPADALSAEKEISIQPIVNFAPNGNGDAYQLGPEGTTFNKPIKLTFKHGHEISATMPPLTGIAFQDADRIWYSSGKFTWDAIKKTVSTETTHFSAWATFDVLTITTNATSIQDKDGGRYQMKVNESQEFHVVALNENSLTDDAGGDELIALVKDNNDYKKIIKEWRVNGVTAETLGPFGKIALLETGCTYTAPVVRPAGGANPVNLSVTLKDLVYKNPSNGQDMKGLQLFATIDIIGDYHFNVEIKFTDKFASEGLGNFVAVDLADFKIDVKDGKVTASAITNHAGSITPSSETKNGCTTSWVPPQDEFKCITVTGASGEINTITIGNRVTNRLSVTVSGEKERAKWKFSCPPGDPVILGGDLYASAPMFTANFVLTDSTQTFLDLSEIWFVKITPE